jgi:hypothetical protein
MDAVSLMSYLSHACVPTIGGIPLEARIALMSSTNRFSYLGTQLPTMHPIVKYVTCIQGSDVQFRCNIRIVRERAKQV